MRMPIRIIEPQDEGKRIDAFLAETLTVSRGIIQKQLKAGDILVNAHICKPHHRLESGESVFIPDPQDPPIHSLLPKDIPKLHILFENHDILVIHKQAGLIVHPQDATSQEPTLVTALLAHDPAIAHVGENPLRPGIVHRLDKDVSGVMVIAKTQESFQALKEQFQHRTVYKEYIALVYGKLPKDHDIIDRKIARSKARGRMVARPNSQEGKEAKTEYNVTQRFKNHTLAHVILPTGRTHQIRVHFHAIDHPLVGDKLYKKTYMKHIRPIPLDRIFLHAYQLRIKLLDGTETVFTDPLPESLKELLTHLE